MPLEDVSRCLAALEVATTPVSKPLPLPCNECGAAGIRNLGADGYCGTHLAALYRGFDPVVWVDGGVGLPDGLQRPEYGPGIEDLACCRCGASWAGICGDACGWCQRSFEIQREHQAELVVRAPSVDPEDMTVDARFEGWRRRLAVAVEADLITSTKAESAWRRAIDGLTDHAA